MYLLETLKKTFENITGMGTPTRPAVQRLVRECKAREEIFEDDGAIPNNAKLPLVYYAAAVMLPKSSDRPAVFEQLFTSHGWGDSWRDGIYDYAHYHSSTHEVLGIADGEASVQFGGGKGKAVKVRAGDVVILPAGTGHRRLSASEDFLVVGAYPPAGKYDECTGSAEEREAALQSIPKVPLPAKDPVYGADGPLLRIWKG
jgi:uncharacterized protein YjlB